MMYSIYKLQKTVRGTNFTCVQNGLPALRAALAALPAFGWGEYIVNDSEGRTAAKVRLAPPVVSQSLPLEDSVAAVA